MVGLVEIVEIEDHPFFIGVQYQYHPNKFWLPTHAVSKKNNNFIKR
jgi:CTP synthase (UTP-ammonia lyase)